MNLNPLAMPAGALARSCAALEPIDSIARAATLFRDEPSWMLPVTEGGKLIGVVTDIALTRAIAEGAAWTDSVASLVEHAPSRFTPDTTGAELLRHLSDSGLACTLIVNIEGYLVGMVGLSELASPPDERPRPALVGGMATPFGVYLTNGSLRAGASDLALVATGLILFALFLATSYAGHGLGLLFPAIARTSQGSFWLYEGAPLALFLVSFRLLPLAGIHAAEHKVVHAIERGEPLVPDVVRRMPRVHPRCGTNLAVGMSLFVGIWNVEWIRDANLRLLAAGIVTLGAWRPLGGIIQHYVTTRPPNDRHIAMGIHAGEELLRRYALERGKPPTFARRLYASGMLHALVGSLVGAAIYVGISALGGWHLPV